MAWTQRFGDQEGGPEFAVHHGGGSSSRVRDGGLDSIGGEGTNPVLDHDAFAIDNEGFRDSSDPEINGEPTGWIGGVRVGDVEFIEERPGIGFVVPDGYPEHGEAGRSEATVGGLEMGRFEPAGAAPGGPEVDDDDLTTMRREPEFAPVEGGKPKIGGGAGPDRGLLGLGVHADGAAAAALTES